MGQGIQLIILAVFLVKNLFVLKVKLFCCFLFEGKYIYIETSYPRETNDKAVLRFNGYTGGSACLSFYYHMFGDGIGQLNVYLGNREVFQKSGSQGNQWRKAEVPINGQGDVRSYFFRFKNLSNHKRTNMCIKYLSLIIFELQTEFLRPLHLYRDIYKPLCPVIDVFEINLAERGMQV